MGQSAPKGIPRHGVHVAFEGDEARKSQLILEAHALRGRGEDELAAATFAEAAAIEEHLTARCEAYGLTAKSLVQRFSAVSCWAQAGNFYAAIALGDEMLDRADLSGRLREQVCTYIDTLRTRRSQWYNELVNVAGNES